MELLFGGIFEARLFHLPIGPPHGNLPEETNQYAPKLLGMICLCDGSGELVEIKHHGGDGWLWSFVMNEQTLRSAVRYLRYMRPDVIGV